MTHSPEYINLMITIADLANRAVGLEDRLDAAHPHDQPELLRTAYHDAQMLASVIAALTGFLPLEG